MTVPKTVSLLFFPGAQLLLKLRKICTCREVCSATLYLG